MIVVLEIEGLALSSTERYVELTVHGLALDAKSQAPVLLLRDHQARLLLPIWIGSFEAGAIVSKLERRKLPRPMTHDLAADLIRTLGGRLLSVDIHALKESTFYACLRIEGVDGNEITLDCRPSDGIAIALRAGAPIRVETSILKAAQPMDRNDDSDAEESPLLFVANDDEAGRQRLLEALAQMEPADFGEFET